MIHTDDIIIFTDVSWIDHRTRERSCGAPQQTCLMTSLKPNQSIRTLFGKSEKPDHMTCQTHHHLLLVSDRVVAELPVLICNHEQFNASASFSEQKVSNHNKCPHVFPNIDVEMVKSENTSYSKYVITKHFEDFQVIKEKRFRGCEL